MVFSSVTFLLYFLPVVICIYYMAPNGMRNGVLLVSSLFFYAWGEPVYICLMVLSICVNYGLGLLLGRLGKNRGILALDVVINLGILGFFKYGDFLLANANSIFHMDFEPMNLPLPIGISFYTFQAMSYIIDLYRGRVQVQKNLVNFGTYIALFPQLIAGPIVRFKTIEEQLSQRVHTTEHFALGVRMFILGLGKKVIIANSMGALWEQAGSMAGGMGPGCAWMGAIGYTFQIYFDFSGYSDMAIGLGKIFGFHFDKNFDHPYESKSITEFWRRWHISLGTWFKEYVYVPLGGNRRGLLRQLLNIVIVWALTGLWHGASWNFVIWGMYFGALLILEKMFLLRAFEGLKGKMPTVYQLVSRAYTLVLVTISWVIFAIDDFQELGAYMGSMFGFGGGSTGTGAAAAGGSPGAYLLGSYGILLILAAAGSTEIPARIGRKLREKLGGGFELVGLGVLFFLCLAYVVASTYNPFLYFRF